MGRKSLAVKRRAEIVEALFRCICKYGLQNASVKKIAEEAGVRPSILHHYFKDRDEIIEELVRKIVDDLAEGYNAEVQSCSNPKMRFDRAIEFLFGPKLMAFEHARFFYDCWAETTMNPKVQEAFARLYQRFRTTIAQLLEESCAAAGLSAARTRELASMIVAIQDGVALQCDMDRENVSLDRMCRLTKRLIMSYLENETGRRRPGGQGPERTATGSGSRRKAAAARRGSSGAARIESIAGLEKRGTGAGSGSQDRAKGFSRRDSGGISGC